MSDDTIKHVGADDVDLAAGLHVGEYVISEKIGEGGFGSVYKAEHPLIGKEAAVKVLNRKFSADPEMVSRFVAEARAVNQIRHRFIIDIFSFGQLEDGRSYYVMEFLRGKALDLYLHERGAMEPSLALPILRSLAHALDAAHAKGIAHRDLKPENIYLVADEAGGFYPKLLDFGIAKLLTDESTSYKTQTGAPMGTPLYMSPEQCRGRDVDHRTDIYAFGCMAYKMLTDRVPFDGEDHLEILMKQIGEAAAPPSSVRASLSPGIDEIVAWLMAKSVDDRPATLTQAIDELDKVIADPEHRIDRTVVVVAAPTEDAAHSTARRNPDLGSLPTMASPDTGGAAMARSEPAMSTSVADAAPKAAQAASTLLVPRSKSRRVFLGAAGLVVAVGLGTFLMKKSSTAKEVEGEQVVPSQSPPTATAPVEDRPALVPAPATDAAPVLSETIEVTVAGLPDGTEVFGPTGLLAVLPATVQLARASEPVLLSFRARGYQSKSLLVAADADQVLELELAAVAKPSKGGKGGKRDTAGKRGENGKKQGRDAIEDPFAD